MLLAAMAVLTTGCGTVPLQTMNQSGTTLRDQTVAVTVREKPKFATISLADATVVAVPTVVLGLGVFGALATGIVVGGVHDLVQNKERNSHTARLPDPSQAIAAQLTAVLAKRDKIKVANGTVEAPVGAKAADIAVAARGKADYVLDIETLNWGAYYQLTSWTSYDVRLTAIASLINVKTGAVVASATCKDANLTKPKGPSYVQLMANDSALIKQMVAREVSTCVATLKREMLVL